MDKILKKSFDLETIEFLEKNDAILAGGSLRSYYKNTNIIDFNFYFKNKETFDKVQKFFRKNMKSFLTMNLIVQ